MKTIQNENLERMIYSIAESLMNGSDKYKHFEQLSKNAPKLVKQATAELNKFPDINKENIIFVGDFIFKNSIGRCDLETGNYKEMQKSINKFKLKFKNNKNLIIYPGHGDATNIEQELKHNIYLQ